MELSSAIRGIIATVLTAGKNVETEEQGEGRGARHQVPPSPVPPLKRALKTEDVFSVEG